MFRPICGIGLRIFKVPLIKPVELATRRQISSIYQSVKIPNVSLSEYIWRNVHKWYNKTALVCAKTKREYSYLDLQNKCNAMSNFLYKYKNKNSVKTIAIVLPNIPELPVVALGAVEAGLKVAFVNPMYSADEIRNTISLCDAELVFTLNEYYPTVVKALKNSTMKIPVVVIKNEQNEEIPFNTISFEDIMKEDTQQLVKTPLDPNDTIFYFFSSGTTGIPKCVEITKRNVLSSLCNLNVLSCEFFTKAEGTYQDTTFGVLPLYHVYGLITVLLNALTKGCKVVTIPKFDANTFKTSLQEYPPTTLFVIPTLINFIINSPSITIEDLLRLRSIFSGSSPLGISDMHQFLEKTHERIPIIQLYGLTEAASITHCHSMNLNIIKPLSGIGLLLPSMEAKITSMHVNSTYDLGPNETGELYLRGPQIMKGYYRNEKMTRDVIDNDNWFKTGDIGHYDEDGVFYLSHRIKEVIKVKGFQVSPNEIEQFLKTHPEVEDAAVIGVPHAAFGEVPKAFIVPKAKKVIQPDSIKDFVKKYMVSYKQLLGGVEFVESIPKSSMGKILRKRLQ